MRVSYYCQHVLGVGHFHRSLAICNAIACRHPTTLILGGPPVDADYKKLSLLKLPGLQMDSNFQNMTPCTPGCHLDHVKEERKDLLFNHFQQNQPEIFITELYPFGRKAFKFELDPVLKAIKNGSLPKCICYSSVRDILVEKTDGREKFERRVVLTLNDYFQGVLIHADPNVIQLETTFSHLNDINIPLHYTGFVTKRATKEGGHEVRKKLQLNPEDKLIIASIGGGNVGGGLLLAVLQAFRLLKVSNKIHLQLFCGPYCEPDLYQELTTYIQENISVDRFTDAFPDWLAAADLSISMAGYNTCMDLIQSGVPGLVYPFQQNREQSLRANKLSKQAPISVLTEHQLEPEFLSQRMQDQMQKAKSLSTINLDGAENTAQQLELWCKEH